MTYAPLTTAPRDLPKKRAEHDVFIGSRVLGGNHLMSSHREVSTFAISPLLAVSLQGKKLLRLAHQIIKAQTPPSLMERCGT